MRITKISELLTKLIILPALVMTSLNIYAAQMPPPPGILDNYACTFNPGKDMDDLMAARDFYIKQAAKAGYKTPSANVWTLVKGAVPVDIIWFDVHENLAAYAASADAAAASAEIAVANERFESVMTCQSGLGTVRAVHQRAEPDPDAGPVFISSSACTLKHGQNQQAVEDLMRHIGGVMKGMGDKAPRAAFLGDPITRGPTTPDLYLFSINDSVTAWSQFVGQFAMSEEAQMLARHFNAVMDCNMSMWTGQWVIRPEE
jgi:hypothetical protein